MLLHFVEFAAPKPTPKEQLSPPPPPLLLDTLQSTLNKTQPTITRPSTQPPSDDFTVFKDPTIFRNPPALMKPQQSAAVEAETPIDSPPPKRDRNDENSSIIIISKSKSTVGAEYYEPLHDKNGDLNEKKASRPHR